MRRVPSRVYHGSDPAWWQRPFADIPECPEEEQGGPGRSTAAGGDHCHSPSYRSHDSGFSDSSDQEERRLVSRVYVNCPPMTVTASGPCGPLSGDDAVAGGCDGGGDTGGAVTEETVAVQALPAGL